MKYNISRLVDWVRRGGQTRSLMVIFLTLGMVGMVLEGARGIVCMCEEFSRPKAAWKEAINHGLAFSLNSLERQEKTGRRLPPMSIRGAVFDWQNHDWIIWGDSTVAGEGLPLDVLRVAVRAATVELDAPGVDIRPAVKSQAGEATTQKVTYFGGVESTVVGQWFFRFDYWMKSAALGHVRIPVEGISSYWERLALGESVQSWPTSKGNRPENRCRFWLKNGEFEGVEDESVMVFKATPMQVCAERLDNTPQTKGAGHTIEDGFAQDLTSNLGRLGTVAPVREIEEFAKLLASVAWLAKVDPYRELSSWRATPVQPVVTEECVATLRREAHLPFSAYSSGRSQGFCALELSGGVRITPHLAIRKAADETLRHLGEAVILARPSKDAVTWSFSYLPTSVNSTGEPKK